MTFGHCSLQAVASFIALTLLAYLHVVSGQCDGETNYTVRFKYLWTTDVDSGIPNTDPTIFVGFSRLICVSHSENYTLWRSGKVVSGPVRDFLDDPDDDKPLTGELQGKKGSTVFEYKISEGDAAAESLVEMEIRFGRQDHTRLSCLAKIVPSPGWFVGLSSENMCDEGKFISPTPIPLHGWNSGITADDDYIVEKPQVVENTPVKPLLGFSLTYGEATVNNSEFHDSDEAGQDSSCFPAGELVSLGSGEQVPVELLKLGDLVRTSRGTSAVYLFSHSDPHTFSVFIYIEFEDGPGLEVLRVSPGHYLYCFRQSSLNGTDIDLIMAKDVKKGERLVGCDGLPRIITQVSRVTARGLYNPHSLDGDLIVSGVQVSSYTSAVDPVAASIALSPLRWLHRIGWRSFCKLLSVHILSGKWNNYLSLLADFREPVYEGRRFSL